MEKPIKNVENLFTNAGEYLENKTELWKLKLVDKTSSAISSVVEKVVIIFLSFFVFLLVTIGLSLLIGFWLGHSFYGFFIMAGLYGIVGLIIHASRAKIIKAPIANSIINHFLN